MNRLTLIFVLLIGFSSFGQYDSKGEDEISRFRPGVMWFFSGYRPAKPERINKFDRLIFDVTYNDWIGDRDIFQNHWASIGLNTNLMFDIPLTKGNKVSLGIGAAHQFVNIRHNNHLIKDNTNNTTIFTLKDTSDVFNKSSFAGNSFSIPIELRFRNESWRHFKFHIGGKIGYQANMFSKYVTKQNGDRQLLKDYGFPDESKLIYSAHIRIGIRNWAIFGSYNFNSLFSNNQSSKLNLVQMGLSVSLF